MIMKIYTSYFGNMRNIPDDIIKVSIALYKPKGMNIPHYLKLAPNARILYEYKNGIIDEKEYEKRYSEEVLDGIDLTELVEDLKDISGGKDVVLLCYEKNEFCHRYVFRKWFNWLSPYGMKIEEYGKVTI